MSTFGSFLNPRAYYRPGSISEALQLARQHDESRTAIMAGGVSGLELPFEVLIDLQAIADLLRIEAVADPLAGVQIGSGCTLQQVIESALVPDQVKRSITRTIVINRRNTTTVGMSLHIPEWAAILAAYGAVWITVSAPGETRRWPIDSVLSRSLGYSPENGELPVGLFIPFLPPRTAVGTAFVARTPADDPIVHAAVRLMLSGDHTIQSVEAALGGVSQQIVESLSLPAIAELSGKSLDDITISALTHALGEHLHPPSDYRGSSAYRREMAQVLTRRALLNCKEQLGL